MQWGSNYYTAELMCIDVHCARWVQPRESRIRRSLSFSSHSSRTETQAACGPKGLHWEINTSACQAAKQLYTLCWISWKIRVYDEVRSQTGFNFTLCHDNWCQLTREKMFPSDSKTCSTIGRWAWIQTCVVFCHPLLHWPWQKSCRVHKAFSGRRTAALAPWRLENTQIIY